MSRFMTIDNGKQWMDTNGQPIRAHGGGFLFDNGFYYWFGENRTGGRKVSCYRSADLTEWEWRGDVLTLESEAEPIYYRTSLEMNPFSTENGANIERPKVLFNAKTGKYVMWMHWENGRDYKDARCAVATSDTVDGAYTYRGSFNPIGHMSRDCTLFQDDDGTAYFISAARDNADLLVYRLSDDYLSIDELVRTLWPGQYREAPAVVKHHGLYYLISSACTGWLPNQGTYAYADSLTGRWSPLYPLGDATTYDTQPTFILPIAGSKTTSYLYIGDRWDPSDYHRSTYAFLKLDIPEDRVMKLEWADQLALDLETGETETKRLEKGEAAVRIRHAGTLKYAAAVGKSVIGATLSYGADEQKWLLEHTKDGYMRLRNAASGLYLAGDETNAAAVLSRGEEHGCIDWRIEEAGNGLSQIIHRVTLQALTWTGMDDRIALTLSGADVSGPEQRKKLNRRLCLLSPVF
ncbi:beta-xylosidase [Paenibacillus nanensis]|uniref:Beta-xylosidase n=1 Tax=Paenibacillus nanensis TaxID=393251 RepID=A0A3A1VII5_9BACL|nr:family 43 glycosylhydrolase [Paenibacillus nanensis]RIX59522.1 beta-xylosidase [Paenibacillus nanensis]